MQKCYIIYKKAQNKVCAGTQIFRKIQRKKNLIQNYPSGINTTNIKIFKNGQSITNSNFIAV